MNNKNDFAQIKCHLITTTFPDIKHSFYSDINNISKEIMVLILGNHDFTNVLSFNLYNFRFSCLCMIQQKL